MSRFCSVLANPTQTLALIESELPIPQETGKSDSYGLSGRVFLLSGTDVEFDKERQDAVNEDSNLNAQGG